MSWAFVLFGALFLGLAVYLGSSFAKQRNRSVPVRARVTGFREEKKYDREKQRDVIYHYAQFAVAGGPHHGCEGESSIGSGWPLYEVGDEVGALLDPEKGTITGDKATRVLKIMLVIFTLIGAGFILLGLYAVR